MRANNGKQACVVTDGKLNGQRGGNSSASMHKQPITSKHKNKATQPEKKCFPPTKSVGLPRLVLRFFLAMAALHRVLLVIAWVDVWPSFVALCVVGFDASLNFDFSHSFRKLWHIIVLICLLVFIVIDLFCLYLVASVFKMSHPANKAVNKVRFLSVHAD
jgi:hypothetical protein